MALDAFASAAETVWWVCAIDEQLDGNGGSRRQVTQYARERDADDNGKVIPGLRWVRDRHTHQLPLTTERDETPFLNSGRGVIFISPGFIWRPTAAIRTSDRNDGRGVYEQHIAGRKRSGALYAACRWLQSRTGQQLGGTIPPDP